MTIPVREKWLAILFFAALPTFALPGCNKTDLSGYRPVSEHAASSRTEAQPDQAETDSSNNDLSKTDQMHSSGQNGESVSNPLDLPPVSALVPVNVVDGANVRTLMSIPAGDPRAASGSDSSNALASSGVSPAAVSAEPRKIELLVKEKTFRAEPKTGALRVSFDDLDLLKVLNMDPVVDNAEELMPEWLRNLRGKTIRIRGFMYPTFDTEGIERFVLARDNQICCFGRDPKIYDLVQVDMKPGKTTNYIPATRAFDVIGKFRIDMQSQDGKPYGLYMIEQAEVIDR